MYKTGKLAAKSHGIYYSTYRSITDPFPNPQLPIDNSFGTKDWGMLGNDQYGDCAWAGWTHYRMVDALIAKLQETWPTAQQEIQNYFTYTGGQDTGCVLADLLLYLYKRNLIVGFAQLDHTNPNEVDGALQAGGAVYVGVQLTSDAQQLFPNGIWNVDSGQKPDPNEGHCIVKLGSDSQYDYYITWGAIQRATKSWSNACMDEAWIIFTTEDQAAKVGINLAALQADINALGGTERPVAPTPNIGAVQRLLQTVVNALETAVNEIKQAITEL